MLAAVMRNDLGQVELRGRMLVEQMGDLPLPMWVGPSAEQQLRLVLRISSRSCHACATHRGGPHALVAAEDDERVEPVLHRAVGVGRAVLEGCLRREWHDAAPRHFGSEVAHQVAEVVFLLQADGARSERPAFLRA